MDLAGRDLRDAFLSGQDLTGRDLRGADLRGANLRGTILQDALLHGADLRGADLSFADLRGARLDDCAVAGATFLHADLQGARLGGVRGYQAASWLGVDMTGAHFCGAYRLRRFVIDQNYLDEFRRESLLNEVVYRVWWLTSDCGRSVGRWGLLTVLLLCAFAQLYMGLGMDFGPDASAITPYYFSVVTLTSLGYGDIAPTTPLTQLAAMAESLMGYILLGGLLGIFSGKMARRGE